jgi:hypothetical protein
MKITFRCKGRVTTFYRTGANNPDQSIPGRVGKRNGTLRVCGDGFRFEVRV